MNVLKHKSFYIDFEISFRLFPLFCKDNNSSQRYLGKKTSHALHSLVIKVGNTELTIKRDLKVNAQRKTYVKGYTIPISKN